MKKTLSRLRCLIVLTCFLPFASHGQYNSYTIDYSTLSTLQNPTACNLFAGTQKVSGYDHTSSVGFPHATSYIVGGTTIKPLALDAGYTSTGAYEGTAVEINFPWRPYHNYIINAYAEGAPSQDGTSTVADLYLWMGVSNYGYATNPSTNCSLYQTWSAPPAYAANTYSLTANANPYPYYQLPFTCPAQLSTFLIAGYGWEGFGSIYVSKIVIQESKDFTISPASPTITCGAFAPITFTIANPANVTATSYVWNLGASNTWLYNGAAAPATITTTTPSLVLTPAAGTTAPTNVSANVYANGGLYSTITSHISYNNGVPTNLAIAGNSTISTIYASTNTYTVSNLPTGATVSWQVTPPTGMVGLAVSGNTATISPVIEVSGTVTLTATVTVACGTTAIYTFPIALKNACDLITTPVSLSSTYNTNGSVTLSWNNQPGITGYHVQFTQTGLTGALSSDNTTTNSYTYYGTTNTTERYWVQAYCSSGAASLWSQWDTFVVKQPCALAVLASATASGNQVIVTMSPQSGITYYNFNFTSGGVTTSVQNATLSGNQYVFTGTASTTYTVTAQSVCPAGSGGNSSWTTPVTVTTGASGSCAAPSIATVQVSTNKIYVFWSNLSTASSFNFKFTNTVTGVSTVVSNIPFSSSGYIYTADHGVTYSVAMQSNCTAGGQSSWSTYSSSITTTSLGQGAATGGSAGALDASDQGAANLYPVPASGQVTLSLRADQEGRAAVQIYSISGSLVSTSMVQALKGMNTFTLNVGNLANGIYVVKVMQGKESMFVRKLVIQK